MLSDVIWSEDGTYTPQGEHKPIEFFNSALKNSTEFDLELGYFNSAAISVLASSFATFIKNGGRMRMAINQIVTQNDKDAIIEGKSGDVSAPLDLTDWQSIKDSLDEYGEHFFKCLAFLIQEKRIEICIIKPKGTQGIAHTKRGQFYDGDLIVSFTGSANFTLGGFFNNREEISISFSSSGDLMVQKRIANQKEKFSKLMNGEAKDVEYLEVKDLEVAIRTAYGNQDIEELLDVEKKLKKYKLSTDYVTGVEEYENEIPQFPYSSGPRDYQKEAFIKWAKNGQKGLFAMATGTGKTITSLNCLLEIYNRCGYYKSIILVPTITLVNQWEKECRKFNFRNIIKINSKNPEWKDEIDRLCFRIKYSNDNTQINYIIIATYASFAKNATFNCLCQFEEGKLLFIADEAHNMGSPSILKRLDAIPYYRRLGLSATPDRQYDDEANDKLRAFFGAEECYTYEYSMEEAIDNGVLCRYNYYPHVVELTEEEMVEYEELSLKIAKYFNFITCKFDKTDDVLKALLLARKRIIHKAVNKLEEFRLIIKKRFQEKGSLKYTLVYVPEGVKPDYIEINSVYEHSDVIEDDDETDKLINLFTHEVTKVDKFVTVEKFVSGEKNREQKLQDFASGKIQVLTSMKCLDEGVDVPRSELAIFCASTGNPRQFIQRRGRILRTHPDKYMATIHDLVVAPKINSSSGSFRMEQALLKNELIRVRNFAMLSENTFDTVKALNDVMQHYGLNLFDNTHIS